MKVSSQRKEMFEFYNSFEKPQLNITVIVECSNFLTRIKKLKVPVFQYMLYCLCQAVKKVPNLNYRYESEIYQIERLIPSYTVLRKNNIFNFCTLEFIEDFEAFLTLSMKEKNRVENLDRLNIDDSSHKDYIFVTCLPWLKFSAIEHPIHTHKDFTIPSFAIGKIETSKDSLELSFPLSIQVHHGLVDGIHINEFVAEFVKLLES